MRTTTRLGVATLALGSLLGVAGCTSDVDDGTAVLKVTYIKTDAFTALDTLFTNVKTEFEATHDGVTVELLPVAGTDDDYATKLALSHRSAETAPDVFYEDTMALRADVEAGFLLNLDSYVADWDDWAQFDDAAKAAGAGDDGSIYAVSLGTDTRAIWYRTSVFEAAGIEVPWEPRSWQDILDAAAAISASQPGVVPFNLYAGTATGEGSNMQGFYQLLYGTELGADALYDSATSKWVTGSAGFIESLEFIDTLYREGYALSVAEALDGNIWQQVFGTMFPEGTLGATVEGSYTPSFWIDGGSFEWPEYAKEMATVAFPTQHGQAPGGVSMSGGWTLAVGAQSAHPELAFEFLTMALNFENSLAYVNENSQIAVRADVAADPSYTAANPFVGAVTELVSVTNFRPATAEYNQISVEVQKATEAVITGSLTPREAAAAYDAAVEAIVGPDRVITQG
ncbi:extracellular solute-binding protein [uncultured Schumannella sp.]|uniref:extracellular solute-binding protein n=1 Tax=uncultured Schumannella sp. TaxID=1195956 RepID=UPI0025E823B5|nr:extracellular solute-binding protein [uncultured Schumannella sp.]